jgi:hypothetical protein
VLTLDDTGRLVGGFAWVELRLFEVVGGWVPLVGEPAVVVHLAAASRRHAARAEVWLGHRPVVAGRDPDDLVVPPSPGAEAAVAALAGPVETTADRLARLYRGLMPHLVAAYAEAVDAASPIADPALRRSLQAAGVEAADDLATGEGLLQRLLTSDDDGARAAAEQGRIEAQLGGTAFAPE